MSFSAELWKSIEPIYGAILRHPFIQGLGDGSLDRESFRFYVIQDAIYLREFGRALSLTSARAPLDDWIVMFAEHAANAVKVERVLHEGFFSAWGLSEEEVQMTPPAPTNLAYTSFLLSVAYGGKFHESVAALLPCYWIYWEVGKASRRWARRSRCSGAGSPPTRRRNSGRWCAALSTRSIGSRSTCARAICT